MTMAWSAEDRARLAVFSEFSLAVVRYQRAVRLVQKFRWHYGENAELERAWNGYSAAKREVDRLYEAAELAAKG